MAPPVLVLPSLVPAHLVPVGSFICSLQDPQIDGYVSDVAIPPSKLMSTTLGSVTALLDSSRNTSFNATLTQLLDLHLSPGSGEKQNISTKVTRELQLLDPSGRFRQLCAEEEGREWLNQSLPNNDKSYLVVGVQTIVDGEITTEHSKSSDVGGKITVPVGTALSGGADFLGTLNPSLGGSLKTENSQSVSFTAPGEMIWALRCMRIKCGLFSKRTVENARLEDMAKARWSAPGQRSSTENEDEVEAELEDDDIDVQEDGLEGSIREDTYILPSEVRTEPVEID